jgi:hypothetical protein
MQKINPTNRPEMIMADFDTGSLESWLNPGVELNKEKGPLETSSDLHASELMEQTWGERFRGWHYLKTFKKHELVTLRQGHKQVHQPITYRFKVCTYMFKFIMPERIEFHKGIASDGKIEYGVIKYTEDERLLGVFRYPLTGTGFFSPPISSDIRKTLMNLTVEQLQDLTQNKKVLTFEAFRLPFYSFDYFSISEKDFDEIKKLVPEDISNSVRTTYENQLNIYLSDVKTKIENQSNILLILQNILDLKYKNEKEISVMSGNIIHFGI